MQGPAGSGKGWLRPPPEQHSINSAVDRVQDHHSHHQQFEGRDSLAPVRFQASQTASGVPNVPNNPSYVFSQHLLPAEPSVLSCPQSHPDPTIQNIRMMPPFSRPPSSAFPGPRNMKAADTSQQPHPMRHQNDSHGPPWDVHDHGIKYKPQCQREMPNPSVMMPHLPISVEPQACQDLSKQPQEGTDEKWLREFEERILKRQSLQDTFVSEKTAMKVGDVVQVVCEGEALVGQLVSLEQQGQCCSGEEEWCHLLQHTHKIKQSLGHILSRLKHDAFVQQAKKVIDHRRMKRKRAKKRKKNLQLEKREQLERRQEVETKIDAWRERLQQEVEQQRREKVVQSEADCVLGEVRQKQSEAQRLLQVLEKVSSLRQARLKKMAAYGQVSSPDTDHHFTSVLERLEELVRSQLKEYELEERTLCVMLEGTASHKSAAKGRDVSRHYEDAVKKFLFGDHAPLDRATLESFTMADHCLETLAHRRQDWDQYISEGESLLASSIPMNWVLPPTHPSPAWATYLASPAQLDL